MDRAGICSTTQYGHSDDICNECCQPDKVGEVAGFFLVASGYSATAFDSAKEPFDLVAMFVDLPIISPAPVARRF